MPTRSLRIEAKCPFGKSAAFVRISAHKSPGGAKHRQRVSVIGCQGQHPVWPTSRAQFLGRYFCFKDVLTRCRADVFLTTAALGFSPC